MQFQIMQLILERRVSNNSIVSSSCWNQFPKYEKNEVRTSEDWQSTPMLQVHIEYLHLLNIQIVFCLNIIELSSTLVGNLALWIHTDPDAGQRLEDDFYQQSWHDEIFFLNMYPNLFFKLSKDSQHITIFSGNLRLFKSQFCTCVACLYKVYLGNSCPFPLYLSYSSLSSNPFSVFGEIV